MIPAGFKWSVEPLDGPLVSLVIQGRVAGQTIENQCACSLHIADTVADAATRLAAWAHLRAADSVTTVEVVDDAGMPLRTIVHRGSR